MRRHLDFGRIAFALALVIVLIFVCDFVRRMVGGVMSGDSILHINSSSSVSDSMASATGTDDTSSGVSDTTPTESGSDSGTYDETVYQTISKPYADVGTGTLVLVNESHSYALAGSTTLLTGFRDVKNDCFRLRNFDVLVNGDLITPINSMFEAFYNATSLKNIVLYSTHETYTGGMYAEAIPERQTGYSLDFALLNDDGSIGKFTGEGNYSWIYTNCATYGFVLRYAADKSEITGMEAQPWHMRYVGVPHATLMQQNNLCLEEYLDWIKSYTVSGAHASVTVGTTYYEVYYVPANPDAATEVPVPKLGTYTISGNNIDGFIVTMQDIVTQ